MPTYDYQCTACGHAWEMVQPMTASPVKACPACAKKTAKRLIGAGAALLFKGSGFYQTDYRTESYKKGAEADSKPATGESKPAASQANAPSAGASAGSADAAKPAAATSSTPATPATPAAPASKPGSSGRKGKNK